MSLGWRAWCAPVAALLAAGCGAPAVDASPPIPTVRAESSAAAAVERDGVLVAYVDARNGRVCVEPVEGGRRVPRCVDAKAATHVAFVDARTLVIAYVDGSSSTVDLDTGASTRLAPWQGRADAASGQQNQHRIVRRPDGLWSRLCSTSLTWGEGVPKCDDRDPCAKIPGLTDAAAPASCKGVDYPQWGDAAAADIVVAVVHGKPDQAGEVHDVTITCKRSAGDVARPLFDRRHGNPISATVSGLYRVPGAPGYALLVMSYTMTLPVDPDEANTVHEGALYLVDGCSSAKELARMTAPYPGAVILRGPDQLWASLSNEGWTLWNNVHRLKELPGEPVFGPAK